MRLLVLPGMDGGAALSATFRACMADRVDVEAVEYPAEHVVDRASLAAEVARRVGETPTFVLGESYSAAIALEVAARRPPGLRGVVLAFGFVVPPAAAWQRVFARPWSFRRPPPGWAIRRAMLGPGVDAGSVRTVQRAIARTRPEVLVARVRETFSLDARTALRKCPVPLLSLRATRDRLVPRAAAPEAHARVDVVTVDAPHLGLHVAPDACAARVTEWMG